MEDGLKVFKLWLHIEDPHLNKDKTINKPLDQMMRLKYDDSVKIQSDNKSFIAWNFA